MLRTSTAPVERWCDKTMSVLRERQLEACQERLTRCPHKGIFGDLYEDEAKALYHASFYAQESRLPYPGLEPLQTYVQKALPREACFLSQREDELVKRMLMQGGKTMLTDWEEISAAEALIFRLWCYLEIADDETAVLHLEEEILLPLTQVMLSENYVKMQEHIFHFDATLHSLLYLSGFLHSAAPMEHFVERLRHLKMYQPGDETYIHRYLKSAFDYTQDGQGAILLLHPGLADPEFLLSSLSKMGGNLEIHLTQEMVLGGMNGILPEETASCQAMRGALSGAIRPEYDEEEALEDLRMMAKQGARLSEMREVMESMLCVLPTPRMNAALSQLHVQSVRWVGMPSAVLN